MKIGSLLDCGFRYRYLMGRSSVPCKPGYKPESEEREEYGRDGALVTSSVGFDVFALPCVEIDIPLSFGKEVFLDTLCLRLIGRCVSEIKLFGSDGKLLACTAGEDGFPIGREEIALVCNSFGREFLLRIRADARTSHRRADGTVVNERYIEIGSLDLLGAEDLCGGIYPTPEKADLGDGYFGDIDGITADGDDAVFTAELFAGKYSDRFGKKTGINGGKISFALADMPEESFVITVNAGGAKVRGGSRRALVYASEKLLQLTDEKGIRYAEIEDSPAFPFRGVHFALPPKANLPFFRRMVKYVYAPMGYNSVFLQVSGAMEYKSHPLINKVWQETCRNYEENGGPVPAHYGFVGGDIYSHEEVAELCDYIRSYGLDVIPEVQTCSHVQYITAAYPELAEKDPEKEEKNLDVLKADGKPQAVAEHSMCPLHPDYYKVTFDILDEVIDVIKPKKYVHIGHDEIYTIGKCPRCASKGAAKIYSDDLKIMRDYLAAKGLETMMWSDMLDESGLYETAKGIADVPKDIICLPFTWYFHLGSSDNIEQHLVDSGFRHLTGNLYSSHFPRFRERSSFPSYMGGEVSTWSTCDEMTYGGQGKIFDFIYTAEMLWNRNFDERLRSTQNRRIASLLPAVRDGLEEDGYFPTVRTDICGSGEAAKGRPFTVKVGSKADYITITHSTDAPCYGEVRDELIGIGEYVITYSDCTEQRETIRYGYQVCEKDRAYARPLASALYRHAGYIATWPSLPVFEKTPEGKEAAEYRYRIINRSPDKEISSFTVICTSDMLRIGVSSVSTEKK
ncbi:MAG: family 20 glycosylhydrolase [Firmicutes bacterium]|nr:family 20 glycosylhydrolase [Candidatus Colimorpha enterica]